jgi:hypothetical protein
MSYLQSVSGLIGEMPAIRDADIAARQWFHESGGKRLGIVNICRVAQIAGRKMPL